MKFKEIKNKKFEDLTGHELSFFLHHLEDLQKKYGVPADFVTLEIFSDLSGSIKRDNNEELTEIYNDSFVKELESQVKKIFRCRGREYEEYRKEQAERSRKRDWQFNFVIEGISQDSAEEFMTSLTDAADKSGVVMGGGFHEDRRNAGNRE